MAVQHSASGSIAEDLFIELFSEAYGAEKAGYLYSQYNFYDIYQNSRYADFLLESNGRRIAMRLTMRLRRILTRGRNWIDWCMTHTNGLPLTQFSKPLCLV